MQPAYSSSLDTIEDSVLRLLPCEVILCGICPSLEIPYVRGFQRFRRLEMALLAALVGKVFHDGRRQRLPSYRNLVPSRCHAFLDLFAGERCCTSGYCSSKFAPTSSGARSGAAGVGPELDSQDELGVVLTPPFLPLPLPLLPLPLPLSPCLSGGFQSFGFSQQFTVLCQARQNSQR